MKKCLRHLGRGCVRLVVMFAGMGLMFFLYITWEESSDSVNTNLWLQSTEKRLEEQNDRYYNELYDRYSRIHRDLNDYQYQTNKRLESLENRIDSLEKSVKQNGISVKQTQINGDQNAG